MRTRGFLTAAVAGLVCGPVLAATPVAAPASPWTRVPALPTACYQNQNQWYEQNNAAIDAVNDDHYRQNDINLAIKEKSTAAMEADPMAMARNMQQAMMNDPQNAQKNMQRIVQQGQETQTEIPAQQERELQIEAEGKTVIKQYKAALAQAMGPAELRWQALRKKLGIAEGARGPGEAGVPDWAWVEWGAILKDEDHAYAANCAQWWAATGPIHAYMKRYRDYLVLERIPYEKKLIDEPTLNNYRLQNVPTTGYRTTTDYDAAVDYMKMAASVFDERWTRPHCGADGRCE